MGAIFDYLELRAQGRTREHRFLQSCKAVQHMLEDAAAIPTCNQPCKFREASRATFLMDFSPSKLRIASTHGDHSVRVSNALTGKCTHILKGHPRTPWCLAFSPTSDDILASGCLSGEIRIWDLMGGGSEVLQNPCSRQVITSLAFHPGGEVLAFATINYIYFWDWSSGPPFAFTQTSLEAERVRWLKFDPYGHYLYTGIGNHSGLSRDAVTGDVIISGVVDDAGDAGSFEERRNQFLQSRSRYQPPTDSLIDVQDDTPLSEEDDDSVAGNIRPTQSSQDDSVAGNMRPNQSSQDPLSSLFRARLGTRAPAGDGISARTLGLQNVRSYLNNSLFPAPAAGSDALSWGENRPGRRIFDYTLPSHARPGEAQPRQRWGRYEPSFFSRGDFSHLTGGNSGELSSNLNLTSSGYRSGFQENVTARMNMEVPGFRQRSQQSRSSLRTNLFPVVPNRSAGAAAAASSFNLLPREQSRHQNSDSDNVDTDEFHIIPIDQGQNRRGENTRNASGPSAFSVNEISAVNSSLLQQQNDYRALLFRYRSLHNAGSTGTSGSSTQANHGSGLTSSGVLSSAASAGDPSSANMLPFVPLLSDQGQTNLLLSAEMRTTPNGTTDSVSNLASSTLCGTDNEGSVDTPPVNAVSASIANTENIVSSCESADTSITVESEQCDSHFTDLVSAMSGAQNKSSSNNNLSVDLSFRGADELKNNDSFDGLVVGSTDTALQMNSGSRCAETAPLSLQNSTEMALSVQNLLACSSSSTTGQHETSRGKTAGFEHDNSLSEQNGPFKCENRKNDNLFSERRETAQSGTLANSQTSTGEVDKPKDNDSLHKYKSVHSKVNTFKLSTARIRLYEAESRRAGRNALNLLSGHQESSRNGESSTNNNLLHNDVYMRSARVNPQTRHFGMSRPEDFHRTHAEPASTSDSHDVGNQTRSTVPWQNRVASWIQRLPEPRSSEGQGYESYRTQRQEYLNSLVRLESSTSRSDLHPSLSLNHSQTSRSTAVPPGGHPLDGYTALDFRNQLFAFQDRQFPRPVADQTSQTLGAMSLPASSDQGTDVVGLNEAPLGLSRADGNLGDSRFGNRPGSIVDSISECGRMIGAERAEPTEQDGLNSGSSPNSSRRPITGSSASRALRLFRDSVSAAVELNPAYTSSDIPRGSRPLASSVGFRPVTNGISTEQLRFHPYSLPYGSDSLHPRALQSSRNLMNSYCNTSRTQGSDTGGNASRTVTSDVSAASVVSADAPTSLHRGSSASQSSVSAEGASRLRPLIETGQPSAFSIFGISNRETSRNQSRLRTFPSHLNSDSLPHRSQLGAQFSASSQNSTQSLMEDPNTRQGSAASAERQTDLQDSLSNISETLRSSVRNLAWQAPSISIETQAAFTEYLERRVMELDRRLTNLEHSYSSRLRELHQDRQWHRSFMDSSYTSRLPGTDASPLDDPGSSAFPRPSTSVFPRPTTSAQSSSNGGTNQIPDWRVSDYFLRRQNPLARTERARSPAYRDYVINEGSERDTTAMGLLCPLNILRPIQLHPDDATMMLIDALRRRSQLDRGSTSRVADNDLGGDVILGGQSHRIQQWDISKCAVPDISDASANIVVRHCKLHNDASCNLARDGSLLATILPGNRGFLDNVVVAVFSLKRQSLGQCLYTRTFGSHAISLSISPLNRYLLVGLASKRTMFMTSSLMVGQVFKLGEENSKAKSMKHYKDIYHVFEDARYSYVSVNSARWLPGVGEGLVYGTNRGDLNFFRVESRKVYDKVSLDDKEEESRQRTTTRNSIATQTTTVSIRRSASTQTANESDDRMDIEEETPEIS